MYFELQKRKFEKIIKKTIKKFEFENINLRLYIFIYLFVFIYLGY